MKHGSWKNEYVFIPESIECDRCGQIFGDILEKEEFILLRGTGDFLSIIGDMEEWELDLCQYCFYELCGEYLRFPVGADE